MRLTVLSVLCGLVLGTPVLAQHRVERPLPPVQSSEPLLVQGEFVIELKRPARQNLQVLSRSGERPRVNDAAIQALLDGVGAEGFRRQFLSARPQPEGSPFPDLTGYYKVKLPQNGVGLAEAMQRFAAHHGVDHVEPIGIHFVDATPNDPYYEDSPDTTFPYDQWHYWNAHGVGADDAWDTETGDSNVVVAVLDSGVRYFHVDLGGNNAPWTTANFKYGGNIWKNEAEIPNNSVDDDGNGHVDDVLGWDFVTAAGGAGVTCLDMDCGTEDNNPDDGDGHGTHVAGTIGAITNNNRTVAGVAGGYSNGTTAGKGNGVKIMCLRMGYHARVQGQVTGVVHMDYAAEAMAYVASMIDDGVNVTAINCSWGSSNSGGLGDAVAALLARDVVICKSAGNSGSSTPDFLGNMPEVVAVAATTITGDGAAFSNHGSWVDFAAPGENVLSTYASPDDPDLTHNYIALISGTSMSSPHTVGCVALLESFLPGLSGPAKIDLLANNTTPYNDVRDLGTGIINIGLALAAAQGAIGIADGVTRQNAVTLLASPNPVRVRAGMNVLVRSPIAQQARLAVYDVSGRLVDEVAKGTLEEGDNSFRWDAYNHQGAKVQSGIYFLTVELSGKKAASTKIVLVD